MVASRLNHTEVFSELQNVIKIGLGLADQIDGNDFIAKG